jgi:hypothetical protein
MYSGLPPGTAPKGYEHRWHVSYLFGTTEGTKPYDLARLCPTGWSELVVAPDVFTTLAGIITLYLYTPNRVTIVCAERPTEPPARAPALRGVSSSRTP